MSAGSLFKPGIGEPPNRKPGIYNTESATLPIYGLCAALGAIRNTNNQKRLDVSYPTGGWDPLYVNANKSATTSSPYSHAWAVTTHTPLWVAYDNADTPSVGAEWGPVEDSFKLNNDGAGFIIHEVDTTNQIVLASWTGHPILLGKADEAISGQYGVTGTVSIYTGTPGSNSDTGRNVECESWSDISSGVYVNVVWRGNAFECYPLECNP